MRFSFACLLLAACYEPRSRERDPIEEYERAPVPAGNFRIRIKTFEIEGSDRTVYQAALRFREADLGGEIWRANGAVLWLGTPDFIAGFRAATSSVRSRRETEQMLLVADGYDGEMHVIESAPVPVTRVIPVYRGAAIVRTIETSITGSGFRVRPVGRSDGSVDVQLAPYFRTAGPAGGGTIDIVEMRTEVRVKPGQPIVVLSSDESRERMGSAFFGWQSARESRRVLQVLTVEN